MLKILSLLLSFPEMKKTLRHRLCISEKNSKKNIFRQAKI